MRPDHPAHPAELEQLARKSAAFQRLGPALQGLADQLAEECQRRRALRRELESTWRDLLAAVAGSAIPDEGLDERQMPPRTGDHRVDRRGQQTGHARNEHR